MSEALEKHPVFEKIYEQRRQAVLKHLCSFLSSNGQYNLSFWPYIDNYPIQFYSQEVAKLSFESLNKMLASDKGRVLEIFRETLPEFELAFRVLNEVNLEKGHDELIPSAYEEKIGFIDQFINYNYLRLVEGVLSKFLRPFAIHLRLSRQAHTEGMDIYQIVEELKKSHLLPLVAGYDHIIRNGIGHSHVTYRNQDIIYKDKKGSSQTIAGTKMISLFDDLLDICNGLALTFHAFLLSNRDFFEAEGLTLPKSLMFKIAAEELNSTFWQTSLVMDSITYDNRTQLMVSLQNELISDISVRFYVFRTFYHIQKILPGFDRYFLSLRSKYSKIETGWSVLNGNQYRHFLENKKTPEEAIAESIEDKTIFFIKKFPFSTLFAKLHARWLAYSINWRIFRQELLRRKRGFSLNFRVISFHRNRWGMTFKAALVLDSDRGAKDCMAQHYYEILKLTRKHIRKQIPFYSFWKYLPVSLFMVDIFSRNFRKRTLENSGLIPEFIGRLLIKKGQGINVPDLVNSEVFQLSSVRINWNKNHGT